MVSRMWKEAMLVWFSAGYVQIVTVLDGDNKWQHNGYQIEMQLICQNKYYAAYKQSRDVFDANLAIYRVYQT